MAGTRGYFISKLPIKIIYKTMFYIPVFTIGLDTEVVYPNGISVSLPESTQYKMLHTIPGLEDVIMIRPGNYFHRI